MLEKEDFEDFKSHREGLENGRIPLEMPFKFKQSFDDKSKRAEFHQFFKDHVP